MRILRALNNQVSGQKIIYMDESGAVCKMAQGNELNWYNQCRENPALSPFLDIIPTVTNQFRLRQGIDKIDLVMDGVSVHEMSALESELA